MFTDSNCLPLLMAFLKVLRIPDASEIIFNRLVDIYSSAEDIEKIFILKVLQQGARIENLKPQPYFEYSPIHLSQDTFRLCNLLPANFDDPILCELIYAPIELADNSYEALSYTWGNLTQPRWIRLNSKPFHVQPNLFIALKAIRRTDEPILLWVDAICINQLDDQIRVTKCRVSVRFIQKQEWWQPGLALQQRTATLPFVVWSLNDCLASYARGCKGCPALIDL